MNSPFPSPFARTQSANAELRAARAVAELAFANAPRLDHDGAFPEREVDELHRVGLLQAPLSRARGGAEPGWRDVGEWLRLIGGGSLALGRLYEGHINTLGLIARYGGVAQISRTAEEVKQGRLLGVWNTDDGHGLRLIRDGTGFRLEGRKVLCSGAGWISRPLVTATDESGHRLMVTPWLADARRADLSSWTAHGMRASATGAVDFNGLRVERDDIVGGAGDYERQPYFSGGAWRFCAVQQGGMQTLFDLLRRHLRSTGRGGDPHQAARLGEAAMAVETARLWVDNAGRIAEDEPFQREPEQIVAYVNLARLAVERAGLALMELVQRSVGLQSFVRPNPIERIARDLSTYLRQPGPDRALTTAAAWTLQREEPAFELWS